MGTLHPVRGTVSELPLHYGDRPYLAPGEKDDALLNCLIASFSGKTWTPGPPGTTVLNQ